MATASSGSLAVINSAHLGARDRAAELLWAMAQNRLCAGSGYQERNASDVMEALLMISLLLIAVDGPVSPAELSQDTDALALTEDLSSVQSAWTGGPEVNMWTGGDHHADDQGSGSRDRVHR